MDTYLSFGVTRVVIHHFFLGGRNDVGKLLGRVLRSGEGLLQLQRPVAGAIIGALAAVLQDAARHIIISARASRATAALAATTLLDGAAEVLACVERFGGGDDAILPACDAVSLVVALEAEGQDLRLGKFVLFHYVLWQFINARDELFM